MFEKIAEEKIREAMANGEFDNLEGSGKPLNLDAYFSTPEDMRMAYSVMKSHQFIPEEVELLRELGCLKQKLAETASPDERVRIQRQINDVQLRFDVQRELTRRGRRR